MISSSGVSFGINVVTCLVMFSTSSNAFYVEELTSENSTIQEANFFPLAWDVMSTSLVVKTGNFLPFPRDSETKQFLLFYSFPFPLLIPISLILSACRPFHYSISSPLPSSLLFLSSFPSPSSPLSCWNTCLCALMVNFSWEKKYFYFKIGCKMEQKRKVILSWLILIFCKYFLQGINNYFS